MAYADFVTAMMAFFMVMWLTSQKPEVKQAIAGYFRDPYAVFLGKESGAAADAHPTEDPKLGHNAQSQRRRVSNVGDDTNYQFPVPFAEDVAELDAAALEAIRIVRAHNGRQAKPSGSASSLPEQAAARRSAVRRPLGPVLRPLAAPCSKSWRNSASSPSDSGSAWPKPTSPWPRPSRQEELQLNSRVEVMLLGELINAPWQPSMHGGRGGLDARDAGG